MTDNLIWIKKLTPGQLKKIDFFLEFTDERIKDSKYSTFVKMGFEKQKVNLEFCREGVHEYIVKIQRCRYCNLKRIERD